MCDVGSRFADVAIHFAHDANVLVAVQERVLLFALDAHMAGTGVRRLVGLEAGMGEDNNEAPRVLVCGGNWDMLFGDELGQLRGR